MARLNSSFSRLDNTYIFAIIDKKRVELKKTFPSAELINLSIGDVTLPLAPTIAHAIIAATQEMTTSHGVKGYSPTYGYDFLRSAIAQGDFKNLHISPEEIYISDGTNSDVVNIQDLLTPSSAIAITNPTYPAYLNSSVIGGKRNIILLPATRENNFMPHPPGKKCDVVYLCSPNNPTGVALTRKEMEAWVKYARENQAILLLDSAYVAFLTNPDIPKSIYEIPGAHECAIEFRSFSKSAGFTGLRCAYVVIPKTVSAFIGRKKNLVYKLWQKRQDIKFNGVAYPIQRGAEAVYTAQGAQETQAQISFYLSQAKRLKEGLIKLGFCCWGGEDSPYIWWKTPDGKSSWDFFDHLLNTCHLIAVPGKGFGSEGEGYIRLSAFASADAVSLALERIQKKV